MEFVFSLLMVFACLSVLLLVRNEIVYKARMKAIKVIFSLKDWEQKKDILINPSYNAMLLNLTRWNFQQFYPELAAIEKNRN